ncbi:hypothetical protein IVB03_07850 [Bradyrhizobium sp. 168]|uniref:hypothetical protein n=1 Tax=Bradyrhizobium sp. 168 TaxID=2782639 RepID=UPI001FF9912B|nr:hypothetical protein [Bradyrhizobium sp. 168]MCK1579495.1 hypothetical protein [Bradyrhizobium sp. 168]
MRIGQMGRNDSCEFLPVVVRVQSCPLLYELKYGTKYSRPSEKKVDASCKRHKAKAASQFGASAANVIQMDHSAAIEAPEEIIASERPRAPAAQFTGAIGLPG